jgi:hypothetical protein
MASLLRHGGPDSFGYFIEDGLALGFRRPALLQQGIQWVEDALSYERIERQGYFNPDTVGTLGNQYSRKGFTLNIPFEDDHIISALTFGLLTRPFLVAGFELNYLKPDGNHAMSATGDKVGPGVGHPVGAGPH